MAACSHEHPSTTYASASCKVWQARLDSNQYCKVLETRRLRYLTRLSNNCLKSYVLSFSLVTRPVCVTGQRSHSNRNHKRRKYNSQGHWFFFRGRLSTLSAFSAIGYPIKNNRPIVTSHELKVKACPENYPCCRIPSVTVARLLHRSLCSTDPACRTTPLAVVRV